MSNTTPVADILVLDTHNLKSMAIGDISFYPASYNPINPSLEITPPGFNKVVISVVPRAITTFSSNDVNLTKCLTAEGLVPLPDGIWELKYSFSPANVYFVTKRFLRTDNLQVAYFNAFLKTDLDECDDDIKRKDKEALDLIWYLIQEAIASANQCNDARAMNIYRLASRKLTNFLNSKC